ncbi:MAG: pirin family protein [Spirochaetia bacterium]|nr:pirin family protein [Spirochaetia bacterium]
MTERRIRKIVGGSVAYDGAGVKLVRVFGHEEVKDFDPFLLLDAFDSEDPDEYTKGFPWHPHRGIETVTYLIHGQIAHGDSLGNTGNILDGGCQWMTAGSGIIHQEMPQAVDRLLGAQLWINLPRSSKMTEPAYRDITSDTVPVVQDGQSTVRVISGSYRGTAGPVAGDYIRTDYLNVSLLPGVRRESPCDPQLTVFCYLVEGSAHFDRHAGAVPARRAVLMGSGECVSVEAAEEGVRFLLIAGKPLHEPIAWGGPIVMNTREELHQAFKELDEGSFIR